METSEMEFTGRSYRLSAKKRKPKTQTIRRLTAGLVICLHFVLIKYQMLLEKISKLIVKHPSKIISTMLLVSALSCLGFLTMRPPNLQEEFFVSDDSRVTKDLKTAGKYFPSIRSRREEVILSPMAKSGNNVLSSACLKDALLVHKTVVTLNNYQDICMVARNERHLQNISCMMTNPLEVCDLKEKNHEHCLEAIVREWKNTSSTLSDGRTFKFNQQLFMNGFKPDNKSAEKGNISARAIRLIYYLKNPAESDPSRQKILSWEASFLEEMEELRSKMTCASLYFTSSLTRESVAALLFSVNSSAIVLTFAVLFCTCVFLVTCTLASFRPLTLFLGFLMSVCVAIGLVSSVSISCMASVNIWQSNWILVILIYCKGAMDALILIKDMHKQRHMPSVEHRIANCMTKSGMALTTSNLISIVVFGFALMSSFPVFREFTLVALINVLYHYLFFLILFMACLFVCLKKYKYEEISCHPVADSVVETGPSRENKQEDESTCCPLVRIYGKIICNKLGSVVTLILFVSVVACSAYLALRSNQTFDSPLKTSPMTEAAKFTNEERKLFENENLVKIVFSGKLNYSNQELQQKLHNFGKTLSSAPYSQRPVDSWISRLEEWAKLQSFTCTGPLFEKCLLNFLKDPKNSFVREDMNFTLQNDTLNLVASYFHLYMISSDEFHLKKRYLKSLQSDTTDFKEETQHIQVSIASHFLEETEQLITVKKECIWFAIIAGIATTVLSLILTANPRLTVVLAVGFVVQVLELIALLNLWDIPLNYASVISLALGFIISVNFSVQMSQIRALSVDTTVRKRTLDALNSVGTAILSGGILAILSSIGLGFIFPNLSLIFLWVLPFHFALGVFHSIAFIPSALLLTSKPMEACAQAIAPSFQQPEQQFELREHQRANQKISCKDSLQKSRPSGVAILGVSCRFPNAPNKELFWDMLSKGKCGFQQDYPANRPSEHSNYHMLYNPKRFTPGRLCALGGAYLDNIRDFDAEFFNISPQEAKAMDPQQRILLQIAYEAIEDAGLRLEDLQKGNTGVFVGAMNLDYSSRVMQPENRNNLDQFYSTGVTASILANRISFCLNLTGPSLTVDTACSSSLVALRIASECLHSGECDVAIVCAPNIILDPSVQIIFSVGGLLAPDGRCKSFDVSGDGYGRGEGFAAVILKLTNDAVMDRDDIYCDIIACGMNNDGQSAVPITAPSAKTQAELSQRVLEESGLDAEDIEYLEAHGTGTAIGDVVEMKSVAKTYCSNASGNGRVLRVGSVKSNLNHTESASGLAGLIKVALMLKNNTLVPTVSVNTLNPKLKLSEKGIKVQDVCEPWPKQDGSPRIAAINSFGYGGTNVHAILQEYQEVKSIAHRESSRKNHVLTLSAHSENALHDMAKQHAKWLKDNAEYENAKSDICWSLNTRRSQHPHRLAVVFESLQGAANLLEQFGERKRGWEDHVSQGRAMREHTKAVFVFGGQGANWNGMGRQLIHCEPLFRDTISEVSRVIQGLGEMWSLENELLYQENNSNLLGNLVGQPATFALQYATAKLLESWGIVPAAVIGHSLGEITASCVTGALTLEDAIRIILLRSRCHELCSSDGCMAALGMSEEDATQLIIQLRLENSISIAAINDEKNVTISGDKLSIECVQNHLKLNNLQVFWKKLSTARAFHSFQVEMVKDLFQSQIKSLHLHPQATTIPMYSTVTGDVVSGTTMDENYWWRNFRQPVQFCKAVQNVQRDNHTLLIEISAQPSLGHYIKRISQQESHPSQSTNVVYVPTHPRKSVDDQHIAFLHNTVSKLYTMGYSVDWDRVQGEESVDARFIRTPTYPWQKKDYWYVQDEPTKLEERFQLHRHAFLTNVKPTSSFTGLQCWEVEVDLYQYPTLRDHALTHGGPVLPGSACIEMAIAMTVEKFCCDEVEVKNIQFANILTIPENQVRLLRLQLQDGKEVDTAEFQVKTIPGDGSEILLARGEVTAVLGEGRMRRNPEQGSLRSTQTTTETDNFKDIITRMKPVALTEFRRLTEKYGFNFGPSFSLIKMIWRGHEEAFCIIEIEREEVKSEMARYILHPAFLDACFQTSAAVEEEDTGEAKPTTFPVRIKRLLLLNRNVPQRTFCHVSKNSRGNWVTYNIDLMDSQGTILLTVEGFQSTEISTLIRSQKLDNIAYETKWVESAIESSQPQLNTETLVRIVLKDSQGIGQSFCDQLKTKTPDAFFIPVDIPVTNDDFQETLQKEICSAMSSIATSHRNVQFVNFLPIDAGVLPESYESVDNSQILSFVSSVQIVQTILNRNIESPHLVIVSRNSQIVTADKETICFPWASSVLGLRRTASLEHPNIRCTTVDISDDPIDVELLTQEVYAATQEDEIAFRGGKRFVNRITRMDKSSSHATTPYKRDTSQSVYITLHPKTHEVCFRKNTWPSLSDEQLQVNVVCTWIADGDINNVFSEPHFVGFSGRVCQAATEATGILIGDEVCGMAKVSKVGNQFQVNSNQIIHKPEDMSDPQAANLPASLATAFYVIKKSLEEQKNLRLLVDETNRGLGMVTILVAKALGHTVINAPQGPKNTICPEMGNGSVHAKGVDQTSAIDAAIFFHKPKPKSLQKTCQLLKEGGKLVIFKEDIKGSITIPAGKKIICERISFTEILQSPNTFEKVWTSALLLMQSSGLMDNVLQITQAQVNVFQQIHDAKGKSSQLLPNHFKMTTQGFVSLSFSKNGEWSGSSTEVLMPGVDQEGLKADRTYIVVGGIRGFGFEVARWMADSGAKTIVLVARSTPTEAKLSEVSQLMNSTGANIILHQADASSSVCMAALEQRLKTLPNVAGIVHTAMVLRDELIPNLKTANFREVAAPKIKGAFLLHEMSLNMDLDFFVLFSSIASLLGNPGQASYAAANAFLDELAQYRWHVLGLPAVSINWGPIKGVGVLQREEAIAEHLSRAGYFLLPASQAIQYMEKVLIEESGRAQLGLFDVDWQKIQKSTPVLARSSRLAFIRNEQDFTDGVQDKQQLAPRLLMEKDARKRAEMVHEYVSDLLCSWTGNAPSDIDFNSSLYNYGMDSFSGLTFKMQLESSLHISFEVFYFTQPDTTPARLVQDIIGRLSNENSSQVRNDEEAPSHETTLGSEPLLDNSTQWKHTTKESVHPIDRASPTATYHLIPLFKPEEAEVKLFCVHPAGRYAMNLTPISNGFTQQSLVAFYAIGYTEPTMRAETRSVRKIAQSYIRMIKEIQRHGPYYLAGQSFGGLVAYEIANILTEQSEDVAFMAMIDTFPWYLPNRTGAARLELLFSGTRLEKLMDGLFEATFEQVLSKLATTNLKMTTHDYKALRERETLDNTIAFLQQRAADENIPIYDITLLQESLRHDNMVATQKHREWKPPQVRFKGPLTYLKSADQRYTPTRPLQEDSDAAWSLMVDGNIDVYICPGDHLALSEQEDGAVVGGILATAVGIRYRTLCPSLPRLPTTFKERRAIHKFETGVDVVLYSRKVSKTPHTGAMFLDVKNQTLTFKSTHRRSDNPNRKSEEKKISIKGLRHILPGIHEPSAIKIASKMSETTEQRNTINLLLVTSVVTLKRAYAFEWYSFKDMREFCCVMEAIMGVTIYKK